MHLKCRDCPYVWFLPVKNKIEDDNFLEGEFIFNKIIK